MKYFSVKHQFKGLLSNNKTTGSFQSWGFPFTCE